jgi:predicted nucleic acid-binding protein
MAMPGAIYIDANIIIYAIEGHVAFAGVLAKLVAGVEAARVDAVTSELTLAEVLVGPLRRGIPAGCVAFEIMPAPGSSLKTLPIDRHVLRHCAAVRARSSTRLPDAIHIATAELSKCRYFLTEDQRIKVTSPMECVRLADLDALLNSWTAL